MNVVESEKQLIRNLANLSSDTEIVQHDGGWDSRVYSFDEEKYFFKFPRTDLVKESYANEIAALKVAYSFDTKVKIPKIIWEHPEHSYFGYEGFPGTSLDIASATLTVEERQSIGTSLGEFLKLFHTGELKNVLMIDVAEEAAQLQRWYKDVQQVLKELFTENEKSLLENQVFQQIPTVIAEQGSDMRLCHGDLARWNIIYQDGQVGIIDFGKVCYSDPSRDLIYVGDEVITEYSLRSYGDTDKLRKKIEARVLIPELNSLMYFSGKGIQSGIQKTAVRIKQLIYR